MPHSNGSKHDTDSVCLHMVSRLALYSGAAFNAAKSALGMPQAGVPMAQ